jgi:type II secretory pathway component GspD/PulD (secretin)
MYRKLNQPIALFGKRLAIALGMLIAVSSLDHGAVLSAQDASAETTLTKDLTHRNGSKALGRYVEILRPEARILTANRWQSSGDRKYQWVAGTEIEKTPVDLKIGLTAYEDESPSLATESEQEQILAGPKAKVATEATTEELPRSLEVHPEIERGQVSVDEALVRPGSVTFRKTAISEVVFVLSDLWGINIVAGSDVSGEVSGSFRDAPLGEVLNAVLTSNGYGYRRIGESLIVLPLDRLQGGGGFAANVVQPGGAGVAANSPAVGASTANYSGFQDGGTFAIQYFTLQFTEASQMALPLQTALGQNVVVAVYPEENRLMIKGSAADLQLAREAIEQLDRPRRQVRITAMIYDVSLGELQNLGINWSRDVRGIANNVNQGLANQQDAVSDFFTASSSLVNGGSSIGLRTLSSSGATSLLLEALNANSESKLLADPSITVGDRYEASIRIVQKIPIITANPIENSNAVFTQTQFEEAGVILNVTPRISRDGTIELKVQPEYSVVTEILASGPVIDSRTAQTTVRVTDGQMFALGGLRQKTIVETVRGVPYLKDVKYIGRLFRGHATDVRESELIVFLRPEIVETDCEGQGTWRQGEAYRVGSGYLDRIPHADTIPQTQCCKDPDCPNHHPRMRINAGSEGLIDNEGCIHVGDPNWQTESPMVPDAMPMTGTPMKATPMTQTIDSNTSWFDQEVESTETNSKAKVEVEVTSYAPQIAPAKIVKNSNLAVKKSSRRKR